MTDWKDSRLKYLELPDQFKNRASEINILAKQHLRACEKMAGQIAKSKPKTAADFEKVEAMKDFLIKSTELNEKIIELITYTHQSLTAYAEDVKNLTQDAKVFDQLKDQSVTIEVLTGQREQLISDLYASRKEAIRVGTN